jgi:hypothetical protein
MPVKSFVIEPISKTLSASRRRPARVAVGDDVRVTAGEDHPRGDPLAAPAVDAVADDRVEMVDRLMSLHG